MESSHRLLWGYKICGTAVCSQVIYLAFPKEQVCREWRGLLDEKQRETSVLFT
jgi:hypothetical protein